MSRRPSRNFSHASKNGNVTGIRLTKLPGITTTSRKNTIGKSCTFENKSSPLFSSFVVFIVDFFYFFFFTAKSSSRGRHHVRGRFSRRPSFPLKRKRMRETESESDTQREKEHDKMHSYYCETKLFKGERRAALRECHKSNECRDTKTTALSP